MKKEIKNIFINVLFVFGAIVFIVICLESFFRIKAYYRQNQIEKFEYMPGIPSADNTGFREKINLYEKEENSFRIIVLGDSYSWGDKISDPKKIWPNILKRRLLRKYKDKKIEVVNLACCGFTTVNEMELFYKIGMNMSGDLVIVQFTLNDPLPSGQGLKRVGSAWLKEQYAKQEKPLDKGKGIQNRQRKSSFQRFMQKNSAFYRWLKERFFYLQMKQDNNLLYDYLYEDDFKGWQACQKSLYMISAGAKQTGAKSVLMITPYFLPGKWNMKTYPFRNLNDKIAMAGKRAGMYVIDLVPGFLKQGRDLRDYRALHGLDGHPNELAHTIMAEELEAFIEKNNFISGS